jgi:hypothetical protein
MNARSISRAIRLPIAQRVVHVQRRTIVSALRASAARPTIRVAAAATSVQSRGVKTVDFAGHKEVVFGEFYGMHLKDSLLMPSAQSVRIGQGRSSL